MNFRRELDFKIGNSIFRRLWVSAPSSTDASDGLGPLFNSRGCQNCHLKDGRGHPPLSADVPDDSGSMLVRLSVPAATQDEKEKLEAHSVNSIPEPTYGGQLQDRSIQGFKAEGKLKIDYKEKPVTLAGGEVVNLRTPSYEIGDLGYGPIESRCHDLSARRPADDRAWPARSGARGTDPRQRRCPTGDDKDGISGKPNRVWSREHEKVMLGRFGWKAGVPTIAQQAAEAFAGDIGISTTMMPFPSGDCTEKQPELPQRAERQLAALPECRGGRRAVRSGDILFAEPRRAGAAQARRSRGAQGQGAVLQIGLHRLSQPEIQNR